MPPRPGERIERKRHYHAFEIYRDLGYGRTYREVARQVNGSPQSVCRWAKWFDWEGRLAEYNVIVKEKKEAGALMVTDKDPVTRKMVSMLEQVEALIDSTFVKDTTGVLSPRVRVKNVDELIKLVAEYRKLLESYHRFIADHQPAKKEKDRGTHIDELNIHLGNMSQEERIAMMKGVIPSGNEQEGDKQPEGGMQEADYTEVPERGDED